MQTIKLVCQNETCKFETHAMIKNNKLKHNISCFKCKKTMAFVTEGCEFNDCNEKFYTVHEEKKCAICSNLFWTDEKYMCPKHGNINIYKKSICMTCDNAINYILKKVHNIECRKKIEDIDIHEKLEVKIKFDNGHSIKYPLLKIFSSSDTDEKNRIDLNNKYLKEFYLPSDLFVKEQNMLQHIIGNSKIIEVKVIRIKDKIIF